MGIPEYCEISHFKLKTIKAITFKYISVKSSVFRFFLTCEIGVVGGFDEVMWDWLGHIMTLGQFVQFHHWCFRSHQVKHQTFWRNLTCSSKNLNESSQIYSHTASCSTSFRNTVLLFTELTGLQADNSRIYIQVFYIILYYYSFYFLFYFNFRLKFY